MATSPIILFTHKRYDHTKKTLDSLVANTLAQESDLFIYCDAARNDSESDAVKRVRELCKNIKGFRSVTVIERKTNYGLARNIIEGVTEVCQKHDRVIVLEDDLVTSPKFLTFMNQALDRYQDEKRVWHISGWNYPIDAEGLGDAFFLRIMNCWGWATWSDRWQHYEKNTEKLVAEFDQDMIQKFDIQNSGVFWSQVLSNQKGLINTWAIYWYATIFKNHGLCLNPTSSYVDNVGLDGSGTHGCEDQTIYSSKLNLNDRLNFPSEVKENAADIAHIIQFYQRIKPTFASRIKAKISSILRKAGLK